MELQAWNHARAECAMKVISSVPSFMPHTFSVVYIVIVALLWHLAAIVGLEINFVSESECVKIIFP